MKQLYWRIYLTILAALALFALVSGWLVQRHLDDNRQRSEGMMRERSAAFGELLQRSLPDANATAADQTAALREWSQRLRMPMALDDARGQRIAASDSFVRRVDQAPTAGPPLAQAIPFEDGRTLWLARPGPRQGGRGAWRDAGGGFADGRAGQPPLRPGPHMGLGGWLWPGQGQWPEGVSLLLLLALLFLAVAGGAWPVVRRLTRRLEALQVGVDAFGAGNLKQRVAEEGKDEVSALSASFNRTAARIESLVQSHQVLVQSHQSLLANASHELRSPLARLKMAVALFEDAPADETPQARAQLRREINTNIAELDALVDEVLLASRLDGAQDLGRQEAVDLHALLADEAQRVGAEPLNEIVSDAAVNYALTPGASATPTTSATSATPATPATPLHVQGIERLLRRAVRNLLENAQRYGGGTVQTQLQRVGQTVELSVFDRGPGVPPALRERIFEAFFRLPGHAEREGGVGLGLALVRQIAQRHGGHVRCLPREGGGSCFVLNLPWLGTGPGAELVGGQNPAQY